MIKLNSRQLNIVSPYRVENDGDALTFTTDNGLKYAVDFDEDANPYFKAYWLNLINLTGKPSPSDKKIAQTVIFIIEEFFRQNPDILLYMCSTEGGKQAQRARLFLRWFNGAEQQKHYVARSAQKCAAKRDGQNTWLSSCSAATLSSRRFLLSSTRRRLCSTI